MSTAGQGQITVEPTTAETEIIVDVDRLIDELDVAFDRFPEETLRSCQRHRQLVIPRLIEVLQEAARLGQDGTEREGNAPLYALFLLSEFQATEALPAVVEFLSLPNKIPEEFLGDAVTEDLPRILATLAIGREEILDVLIGNANLNEYVRSAAIRTYEFLVRDQRMERRAAVERLRGHLSRTVSEEHVYITSCLILSLGYLNGVEAKDEIHAAFEQDMVDEWFINERDIDEMLHPDQPDLCPELDKLETTKIEDTVEELRNWYWPGDREPQPSNVWRGIDLFPFNSDSAIPYTPDLVSDDLDEDRTYAPATIRHDAPHVGRNEPCPCGSGKKYKKCCLRQNRGE